MIFPHPFQAESDGLLAYGGDLSASTLLTAYQWGIFPWYSHPPILWWFTSPRCVLKPENVKISKSMRSYFNQNKFRTTIDTCFEEVISSCAKVKRRGQETTWIGDDIKEAFMHLHGLGYAHSLEVWDDEKLVGGLYGIALGKIFFGESMFSLATNASKFGLISLCQVLQTKGFHLIDCQQVTSHLMSMGAEEMKKEEFLKYLRQNMIEPNKWI